MHRRAWKTSKIVKYVLRYYEIFGNDVFFNGNATAVEDFIVIVCGLNEKAN